MPCERVHIVPADLRVDEDEPADAAEDLGPSELQLHLVQRVHAQVEEIQVRDVGHDGTDLATHKRHTSTGLVVNKPLQLHSS